MKLTLTRSATAVAAALVLSFPIAASAASWVPLTNLAPGSTETMLLLTDGTVMVHSYDGTGNQWMRLSPAADGRYENGTWSALANSGTGRLYFASHVLPDGNVWVLGGEYSDPNLTANWTNTGEIYDSLANRWKPITHHPEANYGDVPSMLLDGGKILAGSLTGRSTYLYDLASNSWSGPITKVYNDSSDEESWVKLPDGRVLTYDLFQSISTSGSYAEAYDPKTNKWSGRSPSDGTAKGSIPQLSSPFVGYELGAGFTLRGQTMRGKVFYIGATGHTALYSIKGNSWAAGPDIVGTLDGKQALFGAVDAPAAEMPSGHVILAADASATKGAFNGPSQIFDFDPKANTIKPVSPTPPFDTSDVAFPMRMLVLPTGQLLFGNAAQQLWIYNPDGQAPNNARPLPSALHYNGSGQFTLTGKRLTGISAGSGYGDDSESDENYPIVSFGDGSSVWYARSFNWSTTGVGVRQPMTVDFTLKPGTPAGTLRLTVSGAGISSAPLCVALTADQVNGTGAPADIALQACAN